MADSINIKELDKIIALCRKRGVESIEYNGVKIVLGESPVKARPKGRSLDIQGDVETEELSADDLLFYSSGAASQ